MSDKEGETRMSVGCVYHWTTSLLLRLGLDQPTSYASAASGALFETQILYKSLFHRNGNPVANKREKKNLINLSKHTKQSMYTAL